MSLPPRLSVIIPHLNEPDDLRRCLLALEAQRSDGIPFEIIVVDNGSTEMPEAACRVATDVNLQRELARGPGPARNRGASIARASLLAFIDADCVAQAGWVKAIVDFMDGHREIDFIGGDIRIIPADPGRLTGVEAYENVYSYRNQSYVERHGFSATGNMAVRAEVFGKVGPFGGIATMEDTEWGQRATAQGYRIAYLPTAKVLTASCKSFAELTRRWDRHVAHEFRNVRHHPSGTLLWLANSALVAASPLGETFRIMRSDRISGLRSRCLALVCLTRIRLYRARRMFGLALRDNTAATVEAWNREKS
ncbi:glycosyl transferase family 2 [Aminobacter sp. AP02]|nr:glycosyl transferase family 2 [Aminobacter sp. AP02]